MSLRLVMRFAHAVLELNNEIWRGSGETECNTQVGSSGLGMVKVAISITEREAIAVLSCSCSQSVVQTALSSCIVSLQCLQSAKAIHKNNLAQK